MNDARKNENSSFEGITHIKKKQKKNKNQKKNTKT